MKRLLHALMLAVSLTVIAAAPAGAVGMVLAEGAQEVAGAQVLMKWSEEHVILDVRLQMAQGGGLWLLPVPGGASVEVIAGDGLNAVATWDTPQITLLTPESSQGGCASTEPEVLLTVDGTRPVPDVVGEVDDVGVLKAPSPSYLRTWLEEQSITLPEEVDGSLETILLGDIDVVWAALDANPSPHITPTLRIRFHQLPDRKQPLPLGLTDVSQTGRYDLLLHVLSGKPYRVENYPSVEASGLAEALLQAPESDEMYASAMDAVADEAGGRLVVVEAAETLDLNALPPPLEALVTEEAFFLTRLHLRSAGDVLEDANIAFTKEGRVVKPEVQVTIDGGATASLSLLLLAAVGTLCRRRQDRRI